jgi:4-hydroxy-2-oxoheptanedioate aldolase
MQTNQLRRKLASGTTVMGALLTIHHPEIVETCGHLGFDFVFIDGQHGGITVDAAKEMMRAATVTGMTALVRVPRNEPDIILEYLDSGAEGIIIPNVMSRADAEKAVRAVKYWPQGGRGFHAGTRAANFGIGQTAAEYMARANAETMVCPIIEDREALDCLPEIMAVEGLDAILIGPGDLALSMREAGGWTAPNVQAAVGQILAAATTAGKPTFIVPLSPENAAELLAQGFRGLMVATGSMIAAGAAPYLRTAGR